MCVWQLVLISLQAALKCNRIYQIKKNNGDVHDDDDDDVID